MSLVLLKTAGPSRPVTGGSVVRAEWRKYISLPSYGLSTAAGVVVIIAVGVFSALSRVWSSAPSVSSEEWVPGDFLGGLQYAQIVVAVVSVAFVAAEYTSGTIQPSLLSVPRRMPMLLAKCVIAGSAGVAVGLVGAGVSVGSAVALLSGSDSSVHVDLAAAVRVVGGSGLYLGLIAVLATGAAFALRSLVPAMLGVVGLLTVAPVLLGAIPLAWVAELVLYLPAVAGTQFLSPDPATALLDPWWGLAVLLLWSAALGTAGAVSLRVRDA